MLPTTSARVPQHTSRAANQRIQDATAERLAYFARNPHEIDRRLRELDREWDIERTLEVNGSVLAGTGLALGATVNRKWLFLPAAVLGFCLQHALQGWCPPLVLFRRMGIRTQREIEEERFALKLMRGDFEEVAQRVTSSDGADRTRRVLQRVRG